MTLDEADKAVANAREKLDEAVWDVIAAYNEGGLTDVVDALDDLVEAEDKFSKYIDVWAALDALEGPKQEATNAIERPNSP